MDAILGASFVSFGFIAIFIHCWRALAKAAGRARASSRPAPPNTAQNAPVSYCTAPQPQQQMQMGLVSMCHGAVVVQALGYPQQPVAHGGAAGYAQQPVAMAMGQVIKL